MFADACEKALGCVFPFVVSARHVNGKIDTTVGTAIMINAEGWFITAGHFFESSRKYNEDMAKMRKVDEDKKNGIESSYEPDWIAQHSIWCGRDTARLSEVQIFPEIDIAVGKLIGQQGMVKRFAVFKDPSRERIGTSLCRVGFPINTTDITDYDENKKAFMMKKGTQFAAFANDGIHTRNIFTGEDKNGIKKLFLEMSTPGLAGQAGGPIVDRNGSIVAMHIGNVSMQLNESPIKVNGKNSAENQYLNLGMGVHSDTIIKIFEKKKVKYDCENGGGEYRIVD